MRAIRIGLIVALVFAASAVHYFCDFQAGCQGQPLGFNMMIGTELCFLLVVPVCIGLAAAFIAPVKGILLRLAIGLMVLLAIPILVFLVSPSPAVIYTHGFEHAVDAEVGFAKLQQWAEDTLARYHQGALVATNAAPYWSTGNVALSRSNLPPFLKTGIFAPSSDPNGGPEITVRTNGGAGECIALCWYDHGLLVGPPQFSLDWRTDYLRQLSPSIYSYYAGK